MRLLISAKNLNIMCSIEKSANEAIEDIEIMRLIDAGQSVQMLEMSENTDAVDTLADLERVRLIIEMQGEDRPEYDCS